MFRKIDIKKKKKKFREKAWNMFGKGLPAKDIGNKIRLWI